MKKALPFFIVPAILICLIYFVFMTGAKKRQVSAGSLTQRLMVDTFDVLEKFYEKCGEYPSTEQGLSSLLFGNVLMPKCAQNVTAEYFAKNKLPTDAWGLPLYYENTGTQLSLKSLGTDKLEGGEGTASDILELRNLRGGNQ